MGGGGGVGDGWGGAVYLGLDPSKQPFPPHPLEQPSFPSLLPLSLAGSRFIRDAPASVGGQWGAPLLVWVRFAQWRQVLAAEPPPAFVFQPPLTGLGAGNATEAAGEGGNNSSTSSGGGGGGGSGIDATAAAVAADVAADPRLDPELRAAVAAAAGRGPLRGTDFTPVRSRACMGACVHVQHCACTYGAPRTHIVSGRASFC